MLFYIGSSKLSVTLGENCIKLGLTALGSFLSKIFPSLRLCFSYFYQNLKFPAFCPCNQDCNILTFIFLNVPFIWKIGSRNKFLYFIARIIVIKSRKVQGFTVSLLKKNMRQIHRLYWYLYRIVLITFSIVLTI